MGRAATARPPGGKSHDSVAASADAPASLIRLHYLWFVAAALAVMVVAIASGSIWFLNWVHVMCGVLWTGIDLFMGFVLGPVLRRLDPPIRKQILLNLVPRTLFLMPTLAIITGTAGWFLAVALGFTAAALAAGRLGLRRAGADRGDDRPGPRLPAADQSPGLLRAAEAPAPTAPRSAG